MVLKIRKQKISLSGSTGAYLLGLFSVQNVLYLFKVGNTYINIEYLIALILFIILLVFKPNKLKKSMSKFDNLLVYFILSIPISIIQYMYFTLTNTTVKYQSFFNGLVIFVLGILIYICTIYYVEYKTDIIKGLWHGLLSNVLISVFQLIFFRQGSVFTLYKYFPQTAFYICLPWRFAQTGVFSENSAWFIYSYRASGAFLECSYFIAAITTILVIELSLKKIDTFRLIIFSLLTALIIMSGSGNFVVYIASLLLFYLVDAFYKRRNPCIQMSKSTTQSKKFLRIIIIFSLFIIVLYNDSFFSFFNIDSIYNNIIKSFTTADLTHSENTTRLTFMQSGLALYLDYPFGIGFNMASSALKTLKGSYSTFNYFITILLELGPLGLITYLCFISNNILVFLKFRKSRYSLALAVSLVTICVFQFGNGTGITPVVWIIFGLCSIEKYELKTEYCNQIK